MPGCNWQLGLRPLALDWKKLYRLAGPTPLGVSASIGSLRDADAKAGGQRPANVEVRGLRTGGQRPADAEAGGLRLGGQRGQVRSPN